MAQLSFRSADAPAKRPNLVTRHALEWMGILTPQLRPATLSEIEPRIDQLLATKLNYLRLPADVKAAYRATTLRGRRIWMASWSVCIAVLNLVTGSFDMGILSGATLRETLLFRLLISAGFAASACLLTFRKPRHFDELIDILPPVVTVLLAGMAGMRTHSNDLFHHFMTMAIVTASTGVALLPIELNTTILSAICSFALMLLFTFCGRKCISRRSCRMPVFLARYSARWFSPDTRRMPISIGFFCSKEKGYPAVSADAP